MNSIPIISCFIENKVISLW